MERIKTLVGKPETVSSFLEKAKKEQNTKDTPVFLLTNLPEEMSGQKGKELGAAGYLVKAEYDPQMIAKFLQSAVQKQNSATAGK